MAGKLPGRAISNTATITVAAITVGNAVVNSSIIALGNSTVNTYINSTSVSTALSVNVGSNVFVNTSTIHLGNSTVNTVIHTTGFTGNGAGIHGINASSIATGTLDTARLPATVNVSSAINVGANLNINTSTIFIGNSTVNTTIIAGNVNLQGTELRVGNVVVNGNQLSVGNVTITDAQISVGNSTVNTVLGSTGSLSGNGSQLSSVNAIALQGNSVSDILTSANTAANTLANAAYSNAVSYANNTFLPLAGGTITGTITVGNSTVNSVVNSTAASLGNTTINGFVNVSSNLTVTSVAAFGNNVTITGNLIVTGTRIFANTTTVDLSDNIITLNADIGEVTPSENAGLEVHRGTSANVQFVWNETIDRWTFTTDGTNYVTVASNNDVATAYSNAIAYSGNAALAYANAIAYAASNSYVNSTFAPLSGAAFTGAVSGITTLAAGNTTITGFINVSTNTATFGTALYVVANGNVGIGMSSPIFPLQVKTNTGSPPQAFQINTTDWTTTIGSALQFGFGAATGNTYSEIRALANGYNQWNNLVLQSGGGGVYIGSTSGNAKLTVRGTGNTSATHSIEGATSGGATRFIVSDDGLTRFYGSDNAETVRVGANGNVGIGTSTPGSKLTVADTIGIKHASVSAVQAIKATYWGYSTSYPVVMLGAGSGSPTVSIGYDPVNNLNGSFTGDGREILFRRGVRFVTPNSGDTAFNLQNLVLYDGKVGIGTDTPSDILTVDSTTADSYIRMNSSNVGNTGIKISYSNSSTHGMDIFYYPNNAQCYFDSKYQVNAGTVYGDIYFRQNVAGTMTTRMTIKGDGGNVGIGNTSPASKLTVSTNSANSGYQTALDFASVGLQIESANAQGQGIIAFTFGGTVRSTVRGDYAGNLILSPKSGGMYYGFDASGANTVEHRFYSNSSTTSVLFAANGNVGIGTTTPIHKLQVVNGTIGVSDGAATSRGRLFWTTSGFTGIGLYNDDNSSLVFGTTGTARVEIDVSGHMLPYANATYNLGSSTRRWATVFTSDLDLSNGIGDWTIVEGEDDLFIYNNKRNKVYKFKLEEVDPAVATPKKENL